MTHTHLFGMYGQILDVDENVAMIYTAPKEDTTTAAL